MNLPTQEFDKFLEAFIDEEVLRLIAVLNADYDEDATEPALALQLEQPPVSQEKLEAYTELLRLLNKYTARYLDSIADKYATEESDFNKLYYALLDYVKALIK
jgi:hypothetical protein